MSVVDRLLGDFSRRRFFDEFFLRQPFSLAGGAASLAHLGDWAVLEAVLDHPQADVLVVKEGRRWEGDRKPSAAEARGLFDEGHTVLVRHAERCHAQIADLAADFERDFTAAIDVHIYCTPGAQHGFGWHYDAEDVFILQAAGSKEYSLRKNTVHPWPLLESLPADMRYEREIMPLSRCLLNGGDWLYIPHGYWHKADARDDSFSLAVGVMSPTALDLLDFVRRRLPDFIRWRQRLPAISRSAPGEEQDELRHHADLFAELGAELARVFRDEALVRDWIEWRRRGPA